MSNVSTRPVVVDLSATADAVWWAADYARLRGSPLTLVHDSPDALSIVGRVASRHPDLQVRQEVVAGPVVDALVAESETAHVVVVGHRPRGPLADLVETPGALALSFRARCPVIAVPQGVREFDPGHPVVVGVHDGDHVPELLELAFAEASALGTGLTVVRCAPRSDDAESDAVRRAIVEVATRFPDVRARTELIEGSPAKGLGWHAHYGSAVVVGSHRGLRSVSRSLLRHSTIPVVLVGSPAHRPVPTLDGN